MGMSSTLAPRVSKIRLTFAFCSAKPIWMPRKPKLMFQISQNESSGLVRTALGAVAANSIEGSTSRERRSRETAHHGDTATAHHRDTTTAHHGNTECTKGARK